ncbi:uncharacterized protein ACRADG_006436 isoform 2-T2 [Cochliomyia hominivorax]
MLKNCILPVNYLKTSTQTCGEIVCENLQQFIINCKLCKMKLFQFEEFIQHFKNVHLEQKTKQENIQNHKPNNEQIIKIEISPAEEENKLDLISQDDIEVEWLTNNDEEDSDYEEKSEESEEDKEADDNKTILPKAQFSCEFCAKIYPDHRRLQQHKTLVHLREKPFKCSQCDMSFAEERYLNNHVRHKHTGFECLTCHKVFNTNSIMKRHMLIHNDKKDYKCMEEKCGKTFATNKLLKAHQRYHTDEMYVCEECGFKCRKRDSLVVHKRHHTGEKPFACELCSSRFGSKELLKEHMACHETERKHICDVCGKSFNRPKALYHHKHLHLGIKKFVCKICGQAYAQAAGLSAHMRKHREKVNSCTADSNSLK